MWLQLKPFVLLSNIFFLDLILHPFSLVPWETKINLGWGLFWMSLSLTYSIFTKDSLGPDEPSVA